jgi:glycosyltransferase involved in cell wall biosynthesis
MCRALAERGVDPLIVATDADGPDRLAVPIGERTTWEDVPALFFHRDFSESFKYSRGLAGWVREHVAEFDVVHIHAVLSHACLSSAAASRRAHVPYVLRPLGTLAPWSLEQKAAKKRILLALGGNRAIRHAAAIHCTSDEERRGIELAFPHATGVVIPLGIDPIFLEAPEVAWSERDRDPYVLVVSRLHHKKNLEALIKAFLSVASRHDRPWRLVIAGGGEPSYVAMLHDLLRQLGASDRVQLVGWVKGEQKLRLMRSASVFALASLHENFGVSVLEALASGVPALVSRQVDLAGAVGGAGAGWIVETSIESLSRHLDEALGDTAERATRGRAARELAKRFAWPGVAAELIDLYQSIRANGASLAGAVFSSTATVRH